MFWMLCSYHGSEEGIAIQFLMTKIMFLYYKSNTVLLYQEANYVGRGTNTPRLNVRRGHRTRSRHMTARVKLSFACPQAHRKSVHTNFLSCN